MEDTKHKVSVVKFQGRTVPIFWAKPSKCSALIALINFLDFKNGLNADATCLPDTVSQNFLTSEIEKCIKKFFSDTTDPLLENFLYLAKSLHRQVSLNPINAACGMFEITTEFNLFTLLGVNVLHGWVLDPEDQNFKSLAEMPYNSMAALSTLKTSSSEHIRDNAQAAENFMNASNRQLTSFGLQKLTDKVKERGIAVLYRDNEFNLLYKHDGDLFTLEVCEDKLTQLPTGVWKKLAVEEEKSFYVADNLSPTMGQHEEKYRLADEWFKAKISAFDDDKKPSQKKKKKKSKRNLKIGIAEDSGVKFILHSSDVDQSEGSSTSETAGLASQESSEEPSGSTSEVAGLASQESSPNITLEQIDTLVIRLPPKKLVGLKLPAKLEIDISPQKRVLHLVDIKKNLESNGWKVEELDAAVIGEDCIQIRMIVNAEARKLALQTDHFREEYKTVLHQLYELLVGNNDNLE